MSVQEWQPTGAAVGHDDVQLLSTTVEIVGTPAGAADEVEPIPKVARRRWRRLAMRQAKSSTLLYLADSLVLVAYVVGERGHWKLLAGLWLLTVLAFQAGGLYRPRLSLSLLDDMPRLVGRMLIADAFVAAAMGRIHGTASVRSFAVIAALGGVGHLVVRGLAYFAIRQARRRAASNYRTVVVGSGEVSRKLVRILDSEHSFGLRVVGYVDDHPSECSGSESWRYAGTVQDLPRIVHELRADVLLVGFMGARDVTFSHVVRAHRMRPMTTFVVPRLFEVGRRAKTTDHIGGIPILRITTSRVHGVAVWPKRAFDLVGSAFALLLLSPLLLTVALAVRLEGGPGVIFKQERVGQEGKLIKIWKFRSMHPADETEGNTQWSIADDARVNRLGRFLRRTSIDELPQLINILRGDMTFVGPRPERPHFVDQFTNELPHYQHRHRVQVGLTGLAQVNGLRGDSSIDDRARFDNYYIENWSLWLDVKVIARTAGQVFGGGGS